MIKGISFQSLGVSPRTSLRRRRRLPVRGEVLVKPGDVVEMSTIVARAEQAGAFHPVAAASKLGVPPSELLGAMKVRVGDAVEEGQVLAKRRSLLGMMRSEVTAPVSGVLESISEATGQLMLRETPTPIELSAFVPGTIVDTDDQSWVDIDAEVCLVQGIVGLGGEAHGVLKRKSEAPGEPLEAKALTEDDRDAILFCGGPVTGEALMAIAEIGVRGAVVASASGFDLMRFTGNKLNPASTGPEDAPLVLVLTEGFGALGMTETTFGLLSRLDGKPVSISGITQVRAGVIRPEVVAAPLEGRTQTDSAPKDATEKYDRVRIIRGEHFGKTGRIRGMPSELVQIDTGAKTLVYDVELLPGQIQRVPRQNVELLSEE